MEEETLEQIVKHFDDYSIEQILMSICSAKEPKKNKKLTFYYHIKESDRARFIVTGDGYRELFGSLHNAMEAYLDL